MIQLLYHDAQIIVAIKPVGADSEDGKAGSMPTLLRETLSLPPEAPIFTVHRLDKGVSGVMVYAKTKQTAAALSIQMQNHLFHKEYRAVVEGTFAENLPNNEENVPRETICAMQEQSTPTTQQKQPAPTQASGRWEDLLYHDKRKNKVFTVKKERKGVKKAALRYEVLGSVAQAATTLSMQTAKPVRPQSQTPEQKSAMATDNSTALVQPLTLLKITLETGRTHQIRVQCASRTLPLVGDTRYGSQTKGCDIALLSHSIGFCHPTTKKPMTFTAPLPDTNPWRLFIAEE